MQVSFRFGQVASGGNICEYVCTLAGKAFTSWWLRLVLCVAFLIGSISCSFAQSIEHYISASPATVTIGGTEKPTAWCQKIINNYTGLAICYTTGTVSTLYDNGTSVGTCTWTSANSQSNATCTAYTVAGPAGTHTLKLSNSDTSYSTSLTVNKGSQTISFTAPTSVTYGASPITLSATGGASGNAVTFSVVSGPGTISGNTLAITGVGTVVVAADQAGNSNYSAATEVTRSITVNQASQTINFTAPSSPVTYGVSPITLSATGGGSGNAVTFSVLSGPGTLTGNILTITGAGTVVIAANQASSTNYAAAAQVTQTIVVNPASSTLSFSSISDKTYGDAPFTVNAYSASNGAVTYRVTSGLATISGSTVTITGTGTVSLAASQAATTNYAAPADASTSFSVKKATPTLVISSSGLANAYGVAVTFTATISAGPTGSISF
jgi:hypothetical protein